MPSVDVRCHATGGGRASIAVEGHLSQSSSVRVHLQHRFATLAGSVPGRPSDPQAGPIRYPVSVFRALPNNNEAVYVFLFQKPWRS